MTEAGSDPAHTRMRDREMLETLTGVFGHCHADHESEHGEEFRKILKLVVMMELVGVKQQRMQYETQHQSKEVDAPEEPFRICPQLVHPYLPAKISLTAICTRS